MLESAGYTRDLGTDVPPQKFAVENRKNRPAIVCMSALLSVTMPKVKETIEALGEAGVKGNTRYLLEGDA